MAEATWEQFRQITGTESDRPVAQRKRTGDPLPAQPFYGDWSRKLTIAFSGSFFLGGHVDALDAIRGWTLSLDVREEAPDVVVSKMIDEMSDAPVEAGQCHPAEETLAALLKRDGGVKAVVEKGLLQAEQWTPSILAVLARLPSPTSPTLMKTVTGLLGSRVLADRVGAVRCLEAWQTAEGRLALESLRRTEADAWLAGYLARVLDG